MLLLATCRNESFSMAEKEIQRGKEAELPSLTYYDESTLKLQQKIDQAKKGIRVLKSGEMPWEINRQGIIRRYADNENPRKANNNWTIFCHETRQHLVRHTHQGGLNLFVVKDRGYTMIDGKRFDWS